MLDLMITWCNITENFARGAYACLISCIFIPEIAGQMNKEIIHNQLQELLETIQEQYDSIRRTEGRISQLEFDILLENLRKFYDNLHLLQRIHDPYDHIKPEVKTAPGLKENLRKEEPSRKTESFRKTDSTGRKSPEPGDIDLFASGERTFSVKLKEARDKSLPRKSEPVDHLKSLIGINDKFIFINELFDGNLRDYNEAIETINGFTSLQEALGYLDLLHKKNVWELGSGTFMRLKEIVEKRF